MDGESFLSLMFNIELLLSLCAAPKTKSEESEEEKREEEEEEEEEQHGAQNNNAPSMFASLLPPPPLPARALLLAALSIARRNMFLSLSFYESSSCVVFQNAGRHHTKSSLGF